MQSSTKVVLGLIAAVVIGGGSVRAELTLLPQTPPEPDNWGSSQVATLYQDLSFNFDPGSGDASVDSADAIQNQTLIVDYGPDENQKAGSVSTISDFDLLGKSITVSSSFSVGDPEYTGEDQVWGDSIVAVYFHLSAPLDFELIASGNVSNNVFTHPANFGIYQSQSPFDLLVEPVGLLESENSSFYAQGFFTLPAGTYLLWTELLGGPNAGDTATGSATFTFLIPEPASASLLLAGGLLALRRRR